VAWKSPGHRTAPAQPPTVTYRGHVYHRGPAEAEAAFVDAQASTTLQVLIRVFPDSGKYQCVRIRPSATVSGESDSQVTVSAEIYQLAAQPTVPCFLPPPDFQRFTLHLSRPLGQRSIVNAVDRSVVPVIDPSDLPTPTYLPAGYRQVRVIPASLTPQVLNGGRVFVRGQLQLTVSVGPPRELSSYDNAPELVTEVAGGRAEVHVDENGRCITWPTRPGIARQVCSASDAADPGAPILSATELVKIARGLR
jgi:hypothetical protein